MARGYDETMPVRIWVGSYGWYNEGRLVGDWFSLPMDNDELWAGIKDACKIDRFHEEVGCFDYECDLRGVSMSEYTSIDSFNALAAAYEDVDQYHVDATEAYLTQYDADVLQAANILLDADSIGFYSYPYDNVFMSKEEKYGRMLVEECNVELWNMLVTYNVEDYFDYAAYGRDTDDTLLEDGYLAAQSSSPDDDTYTAEEILVMFGYMEEEEDE